MIPDRRKRESTLRELIEGERSGVSKRSMSDIATQVRRRLQGAPSFEWHGDELCETERRYEAG